MIASSNMKLLMFERVGGPPEAGVLAAGDSEIIPLAGAGFEDLIGGKLPIALPGLFPLGHGLTRAAR